MDNCHCWCYSSTLTRPKLFGSGHGRLSRSCSPINGCSRSAPVQFSRPPLFETCMGVYLDAELSMKQHINMTTAVCYYHLRRLRQIRRRAGSEVTVRLVQAFVISRLDYCNSVLAALPESTIQPLQHVQNAAVRLIFGLRTSDHITASLIQLHWLPIRWRIQYKLCLLMHSIHSGGSPVYLADMVEPTSARSTRRLRSADSGLYDVPRLRTKFGERAFSFSGRVRMERSPC